MGSREEALTGIIRKVPLLFHRMREVGNLLHEARGITAAMRGAMQNLEESAMTVPELAAMRPVSRQHMQTQVNALLDAGLARAVPNPNHRRSNLIELTPEGRKTFRAMREAEREHIERLARRETAEDLETTHRLLTRLADDFIDLLEDLKSRRSDD